jgi:alkanesulfonate monooxygenase
VRPSRLAAETHFRSLFERTGADAIAAKLDAAVRRRTGGAQSLSSFRAPDVQRQRWIDSLLAGRIPAVEELRLEGRLFAGITAWSPLDIFDAGSSAVYFLGDPDDIAQQLQDYKQNTGLSAIILSGWPLIEEAETVAKLLLPRLGEIL